jgi:predicted AAA+ superfamily ATPase
VHKTILDEVQRVPGLFLALKSAVDSDRRPGRFILTGSANLLLVPKLADSLVGRMEIIRLHPLSQDEIAGKASRFLDKLFGTRFQNRKFQRLGPALAERRTVMMRFAHGEPTTNATLFEAVA